MNLDSFSIQTLSYKLEQGNSDVHMTFSADPNTNASLEVWRL